MNETSDETRSQAAALLGRAADWLDEEPGRWIQGAMGETATTEGTLRRCEMAGDLRESLERDEPAACACASGALYVLMYETNAPEAARIEARDALADVVGTSIPEWNDQEGRTVEEVVGALREAARRLGGGA